MRLTFCAACGSKDDLQHHHLVTRSEGDSDDERNLITLCDSCSEEEAVPERSGRLTLVAISAELAAQGHVNERGAAYHHKSITSMLGRLSRADN